MPLPHASGTCFCSDCRTRARLAAPTLHGFLGKQPGERNALRQVFAWCPWCATWHRHGDDTNQPGDVLHRYPHCWAGQGPYKGTGYLIAVSNIPLSDIYRRMKRPTPNQQQIITAGQTTPAIERLRAQVLPLLRPQHHGGWS
ncbi:hypothetical protein ACIQJX_07710 [Streptomyces griseoviridis]